MAKSKVDYEYKVGDRVSDIRYCTTTDGNLIYDEYEQVLYGTIKQIKKSGTNLCSVLVVWDNLKIYGITAEEEIQASNLMLESELKPKMTALEDEWNVLINSVKAKLEVAAKALDEAQKIAKDHNTHLNSLHDAVNPLFQVMSKIGWRTSSLQC